jgi:hypothetical protein
MIGLLLAMYPAGWRRRYGEEFRAMLESRPLGPFDVADVLLGALDARFTRFRLLESGQPRGGQNMVLRIGGLGAIVGGILWFVGLAGASWLDVPAGLPFVVVAMLGLVGLLLALIGLSAFQAHREPALAWAALAIPTLGGAVSLVGMYGIVAQPALLLGGISAWEIWFLGLLGMFLGSVLFAIATIRAAVLSKPSAMTLALSAVAVVLISLGFTGGVDDTAASIVVAAAMAVFSGSWVMLGLSALRRGPIRAIAPG